MLTCLKVDQKCNRMGLIRQAKRVDGDYTADDVANNFQIDDYDNLLSRMCGLGMYAVLSSLKQKPCKV